MRRGRHDEGRRGDAGPLWSLGATPVNYLGNRRCGPCGLLSVSASRAPGAGPAVPRMGVLGRTDDHTPIAATKLVDAVRTICAHPTGHEGV